MARHAGTVGRLVDSDLGNVAWNCSPECCLYAVLVGGIQLNFVLVAKSRLLPSWSVGRQIILIMQVRNLSNYRILDVHHKRNATVCCCAPAI